MPLVQSLLTLTIRFYVILRILPIGLVCISSSIPTLHEFLEICRHSLCITEIILAVMRSSTFSLADDKWSIGFWTAVIVTPYINAFDFLCWLFPILTIWTSSIFILFYRKIVFSFYLSDCSPFSLEPSELLRICPYKLFIATSYQYSRIMWNILLLNECLFNSVHPWGLHPFVQMQKFI